MGSEGGRRVAITGVSGHWGSEIARQLARDPRVSYVVGYRHPGALGRRGRRRLHRGRPAGRADLPPPALDRGGHGRPLRDPLVPRARQARSFAPRLQRDRHAPAAWRRASAPPRWSGSSCADRPRSTAARERRHCSSPRSWPARCHFGPAFSATSQSSRVTSRTSRGATPRSRAACSDSSRRSARTSTRRSSATSAFPSCRPSSAMTRGFSSSTRMTQPAPSRRRCGATSAAPSTSRRQVRLSLSRILRMGGRPSLPIPHPLFGPAIERLGSRLGAGPRGR